MSFEIKRARGKTAVFSGVVRPSDYVPKLEDLCIQKLLNNVNRIECVGDVPYYILKPLLTKVSVSQLKRIESFNPQLVDDDESDEPWKAHCQRYFEGRKPRPDESWRELFARCEMERDSKIERIAKKIKKDEKKAVPVRQTRVVDQMHISSTKKTSITTSRNTPSGTLTVTRQTASSSKMKPKPAPLMQKSMALFKGRFRR